MEITYVKKKKIEKKTSFIISFLLLFAPFFPFPLIHLNSFLIIEGDILVASDENTVGISFVF